MTTMEREEAQHAQRMSALDKANRVRTERRILKEQIAAGVTSVTDLLGDPPEFVESMELADILGAQRGWGQTKVRKRMGAVNVPISATVGSLSEARRRQVIDVVKGRPAPSPVIARRQGVVSIRKGQGLGIAEEQVLRAVTDLPSTSEHIAMRVSARHGMSPENLVDVLAALEDRGLIQSGAAFGGRRGYSRVKERVACAA